MLVCFWLGNVRKVEDASGVEHCLSQCLLLFIIHAIEINGHEQRADLVIGNFAACDTFNEERDLFTR